MFCKLVRASAVVGVAALFTAPALAQDTLGVPLNSKPEMSKEELERRKANDRAYEAAIKKIPDKKPSGDPWGDIRPAAPAPKN
jgi:hypothetical protein